MLPNIKDIIGQKIYLFDAPNLNEDCITHLFDVLYGKKKGTIKVECYTIKDIEYIYSTDTTKLKTDAMWNVGAWWKVCLDYKDKGVMFFFTEEEAQEKLNSILKECERKVKDVVNG